MDALKELSSFYIEQKAEYLEMLGCELENEYRVYSAKHEGEETKKDQLLFLCKEKSSCCQRYCCCGSVRSFCMDIQFNCTTLDPLTQTYVEKGSLSCAWNEITSVHFSALSR
eukprot:TRINITY_DN775_c0_g1_i14.p2 TRINITY_DN775_c0_g1~~TRINITY_DN775_c0_g1_i14.p2  ORF type:complete len:112 (-),score=4.84 TRINITY_DN775_c0_g1_i14:511-846(-)